MNDAAPAATSVRIDLATPEDTARLARWLAPRLTAGDVILVEGPIGAGKSHFCRSLIQARLATEGRTENVPSPTYTLVQVYELAEVEIWHADLYRLSTADEVIELGLEEAFDSAISLVEWPDRLGKARPEKALFLRLSPESAGEARIALLTASDARWAPILAELTQFRTTPV